MKCPSNSKITNVVSLSGVFAHTICSIYTLSTLHDLSFRTEATLLSLPTSVRVSAGRCRFGTSIHEGGSFRTTWCTVSVLVLEGPAGGVEIFRLAGGGKGVENGTGTVQVTETLADFLDSSFHCLSGVQHVSAFG